MAEFALTAECLDAFGNHKVGEDDSLQFWEDLHDAVGSALPFIVRREWVDRIPFEELNLPRTRLDEFVPKPGEMWVLFCRLKIDAVSDSPIRADGFPLILEWRRDSPDSPLLSSAFLQLAGLVRRQQGAENFGLWPAHARYGDRVNFTDPQLFADSEDVLFVASAYGALAAGLFCAVSGKHPELWPFPTLQWDGTHGCVAGVIGLEDKFTVAADCGARVVTVAREQRDEAVAVLKGLKEGSASEHFRRLTVYAVENARTPALMAERIAFGAERAMTNPDSWYDDLPLWRKILIHFRVFVGAELGLWAMALAILCVAILCEGWFLTNPFVPELRNGLRRVLTFDPGAFGVFVVTVVVSLLSLWLCSRDTKQSLVRFVVWCSDIFYGKIKLKCNCRDLILQVARIIGGSWLVVIGSVCAVAFPLCAYDMVVNQRNEAQGGLVVLEGVALGVYDVGVHVLLRRRILFTRKKIFKRILISLAPLALILTMAVFAFKILPFFRG